MVCLFRERGGVCERKDGKNMVFQERSVAESLVEFRWRDSGNGLSIGGFCAGVGQDGLKRLSFLLFISRPPDTFAA